MLLSESLSFVLGTERFRRDLDVLVAYLTEQI